MRGRKMIAAVVAAALGCAGCAGNLRHTTEPHLGVYENWDSVMRIRTGTFVKVEERSGAWTVGHLIAKDRQAITVDVEMSRKRFPRTRIRRILMEHLHGEWTGIKEVAAGAVIGGLIGGLAVPKHRVIAATVLAAVGAFKGMVLAVMTLMLKEGGDTTTQDETLVYYSDKVPETP